MNGIKPADERRIERKAVGLDELERVSWLGLHIDANHFKASLMIAHPRATSAAEKVKKAGLTHHAALGGTVPLQTGSGQEH